MSKEQYRAMQVIEIPEDSTAATLEYTFVTNGVADDLSSATGPIYFHASDVNGDAVVTGQAAAFTGSGTDGEVETPMNADIVCHGPRDLYCEFEVQGLGTDNLICHKFILRVISRARVVP